MSWFAKHTCKKCEVTKTVQLKIDDWEFRHRTTEQIISDIKYRLEQKLNDAIIEKVTTEIDEAMLKQLAKELIDGFDFKAPIQTEMQRRLQDYLRKL